MALALTPGRIGLGKNDSSSSSRGSGVALSRSSLAHAQQPQQQQRRQHRQQQLLPPPRVAHTEQAAASTTASTTAAAGAAAPTASWWDAAVPGFLKPRRAKQQQSLVRTVGADELAQLLDDAAAPGAAPLIAIFSKVSCGPCKVMQARLESLAAAAGPGGLTVVKVDTDLEPALASELRVSKLPTLMFVGPNAGRPAVRAQVSCRGCGCGLPA